MSKSFRELGVSRPVVDALAARKIESPFRIQELVLPDALAGLDVLARSPTGSGKTLAFAAPIAERVSRDGGLPSALVQLFLGAPRSLGRGASRLAATYSASVSRSRSRRSQGSAIVSFSSLQPWSGS